MDISQLWSPLDPIEANRESIVQDLKRGLAPNLPYFIIGQLDVKTSLGTLIQEIDSKFSYAIIRGHYGNGKSNLIKYLKYYFERHTECNVTVANWRADVDRYDIITFLLYIIQNEFSDILMSSLKDMVANNKASSYCDEYSGAFAAIKSYVNKIEEKVTSDEDIKTLISLGTGKVYDSNSFKQYGLTKLSDYNRREVLVFFLNALAGSKHYILFCMDELEKIQEKSKARFQSLLTTFRELIDLSSTIKGHMLIAAITDSVSDGHSFDSYNPAFERRIKDFKFEVPAIRSFEEIKEMAIELVRILGESYQMDSYDDIANTVYKNMRKYLHTADVVRAVFAQLAASENVKDWEELLKDIKLWDEFKVKCDDLKFSGVLSRVHQKLFAPLKDYISIISNNDTDYEVKAQTLQCVYSAKANRCYVFLVTDDVEANLNRLLNVSMAYPKKEIFVFKPEKLDVTMGELKDKNLVQVKDLILYNPIELIALLELYLDDYENEALFDVLQIYTHQL